MRPPLWLATYARLLTRRSPICGLGLYTPVAIAKRAKIGEFEGERLPIREARRRVAGKRIVAVVELDRVAIDASKTRHGFRYINHSCEPNTYMRRTKDRAEFYALRDIRPGEELTLDYEDSHHEGRLPCRCGAAGCRGWI